MRSLFYNHSGGDILEIIERDSTNSKIGSWKFNIQDKKLANNILSYLIKKYGFNPEMNPKKDIFSLDVDI